MMDRITEIGGQIAEVRSFEPGASGSEQADRLGSLEARGSFCNLTSNLA